MHLFMSWCFAYRRALFSLGGKRCAGQPTSQLKSLSNGPRGQYDVVVAGGGIMGCSSAYFLAQRIPGSSICVIERDPKYQRASTVLSMGGIRQQFSTRGNIEMSMYSCDFVKNIGRHLGIEGEDPPDVQFVEGGYLFLASEAGEEIMRENYVTQRSVGATVELMSPSQLQKKFPWLNTEGIALGCFGVQNEGWFDPWSFLTAFKRKVIAMGVHYLHGNVVGIDVHSNRVTSVQVQIPSGEKRRVQCDYLVNAAGPWASNLALMAGVGEKGHGNSIMGVELPVKPRKRQVFVFKCPSGPGSDCPLVVDSSGVYFRREGQGSTFTCGHSPPEHEDKDTDDLDVDYSYFDEHLWPILAERVPAFEALKLQNAWAGFYEYNTLDQNAIIGTHPVISNLVLANGFSGHGIQQSPAVGRAVSEEILDGGSHSIQLGLFSFQRIVEGRPIRERNVV